MPDWLKRLLLRLAAVGVAVGLVLFVRDLLDAGGQDADAHIQRVRLIDLPPPPPPPPPKKVEEPPEVQAKKEIEIEDDAKSDEKEAPADDRLGLDAEGGGTDAFGLAAKKGGRDLLSGVKIGGDAQGDAQRFAYFDSHVERFLERLLSGDGELRQSSYTAIIDLWVGPRGRIERIELSRSTGNPALDARLMQALLPAVEIGLSPPEGIPQPIRIRLVSRAKA